MKTQLMITLLLAAGTAMAQQGGGQSRQAPSAQDLITRLDTDKDGKISESEFDGPAEHFSQFDTNGDGYLSTDEIPSGPPTGQNGQSSQQGQRGGMQGGQQGMMQGGQRSAETGAAFVTRLDKDSDGKVSSTEFDGPSELFTQLDADSDGYLSESEAPTGPPQGQRGGRRQ